MSRPAARRRLALLAAGSLASLAAFAPAAGALTLQPGGVVNSPDYCVAVYGDPNPCPPPDRPDPVDPGCLRTDITPLRCAWLP